MAATSPPPFSAGAQRTLGTAAPDQLLIQAAEANQRHP